MEVALLKGTYVYSDALFKSLCKAYNNQYNFINTGTEFIYQFKDSSGNYVCQLTAPIRVITYVHDENSPFDENNPLWKKRNDQLTGIQNTLAALGFEPYSYIPGTGMSKEYWRDIEHNRYVGVTYIGYIDVDILIEEIFP